MSRWQASDVLLCDMLFLSCSQLLEQLRGNRASLKPPQLQMLEQLEAQLAMMHQHQVQTTDAQKNEGFVCSEKDFILKRLVFFGLSLNETAK